MPSNQVLITQGTNKMLISQSQIGTTSIYVKAITDGDQSGKRQIAIKACGDETISATV